MATSTPDTKQEFIQLINNKTKFRLFMLRSLPMAYIAGLRIKSFDMERAAVTVKYKWLTQNPFRSLYFAVLAMAAELSTGVLSLLHVYKSKPRVSMLVLKMQAEFTKKAVGTITFTCQQGEEIRQAIEKSKETGEGTTVTATSTGTDEQGDIVARFQFTWTYKPVKKK